jgi:hypothetical protein
MRFMMIVKSNALSEAGIMPDEKILTEMGNLNEEMARAGVMLSGDGLQPSKKGVRVRLDGKRFIVVDGPFAETKELVAGYWLVQTKSRDEAVAWARRAPIQEGEIEIRPLYELEDFPVDPAETASGWRDEEQRMRREMDVAGPAHPARKPGTTRYLVMLKGNASTEAGALPKPAVLAAMGRLMQEMAASGAMLGGEGLKPTSQGVRVRFSGDRRTVIDGPFTESKEIIAGYTLMQAASVDEVVAFAKRWLQIHVEGLDIGGAEIEIRPAFELEDFPVDPAEKPDGWRQQEQRLRERLGQ